MKSSTYNYSANILSRHPSHKIFRPKKGKTVPFGMWPVPVQVGFGSDTQSSSGTLRINTPAGVANSSSKFRSKQLFVEHNVPTPSHIITAPGNAGVGMIAEAIAANKLTYPIVAKICYGSGGKGMKKLDTAEETQEFFRENGNKKYLVESVFQPILKYCREYRIHVSPLLQGVEVSYSFAVTNKETGEVTTEQVTLSNGEIFSVRKLMVKEAAERNEFGRNIALGNAYFSRKFDRASKSKNGVQNWEAMVTDSNKAVAALGLDFGAVDILWCSQTNTHTILEVNSAPSMGLEDDGDKITAQAYMIAMKKIIAKKLETFKPSASKEKLTNIPGKVKKTLSPTVTTKQLGKLVEKQAAPKVVAKPVSTKFGNEGIGTKKKKK